MWHRVEEVEVRISQYLASNGVGVYLVGNHNESMADASPRIDPYVTALRATLDDDSFHDVTSHGHRCSTSVRIESHDRSNWDRMVDWLDDRRKTYERVLRNSPGEAE